MLLLRCWLLMLLFAGPVWAQPPVLAPDARNHIGQTATVDFVVRTASRVATKKNGTMLFLNSAVNHRAADNFAVVINEQAAQALGAAGIVAPETHFTDKQIQVSGLIQERKGAVLVEISGPTDIKIVNPYPEPAADQNVPLPASQPDDFNPTPPSNFRYYLIGFSVVVLIGGLVARKYLKKDEGD